MKKKSSQQSRTSHKNQHRPPDFTGDDSGPVVLGIDPGTLVTGYGIIKSRDGKLCLLASGAFRNNASTLLPERLRRIHEGLSQLMSSYHPAEFAIESAFHGKNAQSALKLGHARGVLILAAASHGLQICEYTPREIKKALTGNGNASKLQVQFMVRSLLETRVDSMILDTSDAIATAICHLQRLNGQRQAPKDWKSFATAHPERVIS